MRDLLSVHPYKLSATIEAQDVKTQFTITVDWDDVEKNAVKDAMSTA